MDQFSIPCSVYRGGTSRGLFFHAKDLPQDSELRKNVFLRGIDAFNPSQIDGLGSGSSHTSKVAVIAPSPEEEVDVDYTFYQIGIGEELVDDSGTCGNLMAAVGAFAVDEKLVETNSDNTYVTVMVRSTNIDKLLRIQVPVENREAMVSGDYFMPGVIKPGAKFLVDILQPGGGKTGKTLPLGPTAHLNGRAFSFVDVINPYIYVSNEAFGIQGMEPNHTLSARTELLAQLETVRCEATVAAHLADSIEEARRSPVFPKIAIVSPPQHYETSDGRRINKEDVDLCAKLVSMGRFHRTFAASGLYNVAAAALLQGTIPNRRCTKEDSPQAATVRIGHPEGIVEVRVSLSDNREDIAFVGLERTTRRIMKGELYIPNE